MDAPDAEHQGVDADVGVGKLGSERVAQPVDKCAAGAVGVDAGAAKGPPHPVCRVPRVMRSPSAPTNSGVPVGQAVRPPPGEERRLAAAGKRRARVSR